MSETDVRRLKSFTIFLHYGIIFLLCFCLGKQLGVFSQMLIRVDYYPTVKACSKNEFADAGVSDHCLIITNKSSIHQTKFNFRGVGLLATEFYLC